MDFDLGTFIIGVLFGLLLIPMWRGVSKMCDNVVKEERNKKKQKDKKKKGFPYKNKARRNEIKN